MLTQDYLKTQLNYDSITGVFTWRARKRGVFVGMAAGTNNGGRIEIGVDGRKYKAHRLAWLYVYGVWPTNEIDHKDRNPSNNAISNLNDVTHKENLENTKLRRDNTSGLKGVSWSKKDKRWAAKIQHNGKTTFLGNFLDKRAAHNHYIHVAKNLHTYFSSLGVQL